MSANGAKGSGRAEPMRDTRGWVGSRLKRGTAYQILDGRAAMLPEEIERATAAAVLVPLVNRSAGVTVLFTQRTAHLTDHGGQISFPGGRVDPGDRCAEDTALRETEEEIGLPRTKVELLGNLPVYLIPTGYKVTPVVGWIEPPFTLRPDPNEVAEVFEVPLDFFLDPVNHRRETAMRAGRLRDYYAIAHDGRNIWGATAGMLVMLYQTLLE